MTNLRIEVDDIQELKTLLWNSYNAYLKGHTTIEEETNTNGVPTTRVLIDTEQTLTLESCEATFFSIP